VSGPRVWSAGAAEAADVTRLLTAFRDWWGRDWPDDASFARSVERLMGDPGTEFLLAAAAEDAEPAGVCQVRYRWSAWWEAEDAFLEDLYVLDSARGHGLGRALTEAAAARAAERGCRRIELDVSEANEPAMALYTALGFESGKLASGRDVLMRRAL
jgi:ribosomal protein S18 acetylase RimI-like enzyme